MTLPKGARVIGAEGRLVVVQLPRPPKDPETGPTARPGRLERDRANAEEVRRIVEAGDAYGMRPSRILLEAGFTSSPGYRAVALAESLGWVRRRANGYIVRADAPVPHWEQKR
jgi:hypothetical protein